MAAPMNVTLAPKVADRIGRAFPQRALLLGIEWFRTGGVEVESITDDAVAAAVKGKRRQQVRLAVASAGKAIATSCSCHASTLEGAVCSHVWAVVLEVDRRGALERLRTSNGNARVVALEEKAQEPEKVTPKAQKAEKRAAKEVLSPPPSPASGRPSRRSPRASAPPPERPAPKPRRPRKS